MLQQRAYDTVKEYDEILPSAGAVASIADNGSGKVRITTTGNHGIAQKQVDDGHIITLTGSIVDAGAYNAAHTVTDIISPTIFDTDFDFGSPEAGVASFLVEKIYVFSPGLLATLGIDIVDEMSVFLAIQEVSANDKHSQDIVWLQVATLTGSLHSGDSTTITGVKFSGNPTAAVRIVASQMARWF